MTLHAADHFDPKIYEIRYAATCKGYEDTCLRLIVSDKPTPLVRLRALG